MSALKKILFIDDNNDFLNLTLEELEDETLYQVETLLVSSFGEALPQILASKPDLIFLDVMFSKNFSNSLAAQIRETPELLKTPVYLMSFLDLGEIMAIANKNHVNGAFMKPIHYEDLQDLFLKHFQIDLPDKAD